MIKSQQPPFRIALTADFYDDAGESKFDDLGLAVFEGHDHIQLTQFGEHRQEITSGQLADCSGVIVLTPRLTAESLAGCDDLLAVGRFGVGYDSVDVNACTEQNVLAMITVGAVDRPVAEATLGWMIALTHHMFIKDRLVRTGQWDDRTHYMGSELRDRTLGVIGNSGYAPGHNLGVRITNVGDEKFEVAQVADGVLEPGVVTLAANDLPDGGFGFEYCCNRSFVVDNVLIETSSRSATTRPDQNLAVSSPASIEEVRRKIEQKRTVLHAELERLRESKPREPGQLALVADYSADLPTVPLLIRGEHETPGESVPGAAPHVLGERNNPIDLDRNVKESSVSSKSTGRRLAFARWLTQPNSRAAGLLARVTVNRWWQYHFGRGIVATTENLGYSGAAPTHPKLLNFLAAELVRQKWKPKALHRLILRSAVYRQQNTSDTLAQKIDPKNQLLWRYPMRRLDAEAIRDGMLTVAGELEKRMFGPYVPTEYTADGQVIVKPNAEGQLRRSIYLQQRRTQVLDMLKVFDAPLIVSSCTGRPRTTVPLQSLNLLNSPFIRCRAEAMAARIDAKDHTQNPEFTRRAFVLALGRDPHPAELEASLTFLTDQPSEYTNSSNVVRRARVDFCQMVLASNAFLYIE